MFESEALRRLTPYREILKTHIDNECSSLKNCVELLDKLYKLLQDCEPECMKIAEERKVDRKQASVAIAGSLFPWGACYILEKIRDFEKIPVIFSLTKKHELVEKYATIRVGSEILKPDMDLLIFSEREDTPLLICSLKTSLRERAGQTHRWKMVLDIALKCKELKEKYALNYEVKRDIKFVFITTNFYNEIYQPQQRAMFRFFDFVYLARDDIDVIPPVKRLSCIVDDLKEIYK